jgi:hypothetical protein
LPKWLKLLFIFGMDQESAQFRQVLFLGLHFNLKLFFTTPALQDPPLCMQHDPIPCRVTAPH